ncbi:uncharacterized protein EI90DRAFT_3063483, partial [Cantharellus anzutake]|uniref:uncharacterized protein n=1 Tax=Cantharellus anzutake TaxID=1750568 RepID=UPI001908DB47
MISLTTSVTNLVKSSLRGDRPMNRYSSITYDPIGDDLSSFSNPLPTLLRQVVLSVRTEIDTGSESILKLTTLIGDPRVSGAVESVLNALKKCYKSVDHIFGAPDAPQILSSTRGLLTALHQALHEHLHACHGVQRARIISSSFFELV